VLFRHGGGRTRTGSRPIERKDPSTLVLLTPAEDLMDILAEFCSPTGENLRDAP